jgi:hypothetical protein
MSLFKVSRFNPSAYDLANETLSNIKAMFEQLHDQVKKDHQSLWYANGGLDGPKPTGLQVLQALGDKAQHVMFAAKARVDLLQAVAASLGMSSAVDWAGFVPPYDFVWNTDGSLGNAVPKRQ